MCRIPPSTNSETGKREEEATPWFKAGLEQKVKKGRGLGSKEYQPTVKREKRGRGPPRLRAHLSDSSERFKTGAGSTDQQ